MTQRVTAVPSAQGWHDSARDREQPATHRLMCALSAFDHTENALFAVCGLILERNKAGDQIDPELLEMAQRYAPKRVREEN